MVESVFTKIIKGEIPCHKIYEDEKTMAFMEIRPIQPGHVLVITKKQLHIWDLPDEEYQALMKTVKKVADRISEILKPRRVGIQVVGLHVPDHAHVHVFPFNSMEEYRHDPDSDDPDHAALAEMAAKLRFGNK
ncbi:MAG: HIT domain-containing protein [Candidatus Saccharimonadales bacterium]|jgi:histidine triad (HIT) family protein